MLKLILLIFMIEKLYLVRPIPYKLGLFVAFSVNLNYRPIRPTYDRPI